MLLFYMNFNAIKVARFLMHEIADSINALPEQNQRVERLADYLKQCNQTQTKPVCPSGITCPHLKNN
jgi:hypothetical protein